MVERTIDHDAGMHSGAIDSAMEQLFGSDHAVLVVEEQTQEHLAFVAPQPAAQVVAGEQGGAEAITALQAFLQVPLCQL